MPKFRKKPVVIEAWQYVGCEDGKLPKGACDCGLLMDGIVDGCQPHVHTTHSNQRVYLEIGDWIIPEPDGEHFYPCKPDIFAATYEPVEQFTVTKRPTIEELERILAQNPGDVGIVINPDGSVAAVHKSLDCVAAAGSKATTQTIHPSSY